MNKEKLTHNSSLYAIVKLTKAYILSPIEIYFSIKKLALIIYKKGIASALVSISLSWKKIDRNNYKNWISSYDTLSEYDRECIRKHISEFQYHPLFSVVMPVYNPPPHILCKAIESVRHQIYLNWELCIADDASTNPDIRMTLMKYQEADSRIKIIFREANGRIAAASNSALKLANGEFIALLDHDDELSEHALYFVALKLNENKNLDLIYSDEDKISMENIRSNPVFKPDWSPDLLLTCNYINHLGVYRTSKIKEIKGFRMGFEGSQDYDLLLRFIEKTTSEKIAHIPRILYHWRSIPGSVAFGLEEKPYTFNTAIKAVTEHLNRINQNVIVKKIPEKKLYFQRVCYELLKKPLVSIIIPTKNQHNLLKKCISSIISLTDYKPFEIIVINNQSNDLLTIKYLKTIQNSKLSIKVLDYDLPFNYSKLNNFAVSKSRGEVICLLNNDTEVIEPAWLTEMVSLALRSGTGAVGAKLLYPDNTIQHGGVILGLGGAAGHAHKRLMKSDNGYCCRAVLMQNLSAVTGACLVVKRKLFLNIGGLDENLGVAYNDVDFCLRLLEAGYRNVWTPYAVLYHHESKSRGYEDTVEKIRRFEEEISYMKNRWGKILENDPAYNPNLTLSHEDFSLAWPPRVKKPWLEK